jgi:hypothetical protein
MAKPRVKVNIDQGALKKVLQKAVQGKASELTRALNALTATHQGKPLDEVKRAVQATWTRHAGRGGSITDPELTKFAEEIAAGRRVQVRAK